MRFTKLSTRLRDALIEDAAFSDATTHQIPSLRSDVLTANLVAKADGILCGGFLISQVFSQLDPRARVRILKQDGASVKSGQVVARIRAKGAALLAGERVMLNLVTHLSGIATLTRRYANAVKNSSAKIFDTRKTTLLWRDLEKYAVRCGGGENHRFSLEDAILVKDNHNDYLRNKKISPVSLFSKNQLGKKTLGRLKFVAMEARDYREVWNGIKAGADIILLDNMPLNRLKGSMIFIKAARKAMGTATPLVEVSGGVTPEKARRFAALGVDRISVGAITHSAPALDLSLEVQ
jgi:nicotinate-nucleotide pyrophosphorylase (carboxylating)